MRRISILLSFFALMMMLVGCSKSAEVQGGLSPKETIVQFFEFHNGKDLLNMEPLLTEGRQGISWQLEKLNSIKILSIEEESSDQMTQQYIDYGRGKNYEKSNISVFQVEFEVDYRGGFGSGIDNGVHTWWYYLVRDSVTSPWKIDDWGH